MKHQTLFLRTLKSAIVAPDELIADLKKAINEGDETILPFLNERVYSKKSSIPDTIPKNKRINFSNDYVQQVSGGKTYKYSFKFQQENSATTASQNETERIR